MEIKQLLHRGYNEICYPVSTNYFSLLVILTHFLLPIRVSRISISRLWLSSRRFFTSFLSSHLPNLPLDKCLDDTQDREHAHWLARGRYTLYGKYDTTKRLDHFTVLKLWETDRTYGSILNIRILSTLNSLISSYCLNFVLLICLT